MGGRHSLFEPLNVRWEEKGKECVERPKGERRRSGFIQLGGGEEQQKAEEEEEMEGGETFPAFAG